MFSMGNEVNSVMIYIIDPSFIIRSIAVFFLFFSYGLFSVHDYLPILNFASHPIQNNYHDS